MFETQASRLIVVLIIMFLGFTAYMSRSMDWKDIAKFWVIFFTIFGVLALMAYWISAGS